MAHNMTFTPTGRRLRASCSCGKRWTLPAYTCEVEQHPGANFLAVRAGNRTAFLKAVGGPSSDARGGAQLVRAKLVGSMSIAHAAGVARYLREQSAGAIGALPVLPALAAAPEQAARPKVPIVTKTALSPAVLAKPLSKKAQRRATKLAKKAAKDASKRLLNRQHRARVLNGTGVTPAVVTGLPTYDIEPPPWGLETPPGPSNSASRSPDPACLRAYRLAHGCNDDGSIEHSREWSIPLANNE